MLVPIAEGCADRGLHGHTGGWVGHFVHLSQHALRRSLVLVTGAAGGLGRAIAEAVHAEGAHLVLTTRNADSLPRAAAGLDRGPEVVTAAADVTNDAELAKAVELANARLGGIDVLVNNAGVSGPAGTSRSPRRSPTCCD